MTRLEPKHPRAVRWMHWINVPLLTIMIWSGLLIYWANDVYSHGRRRFHPFSLLPGLVLPGAWPGTWPGYREWRITSPSCGSLPSTGSLYVLYTFLSGEWRHLLPNRHTLGEAWQVVLHDLRLRKEPLPRAKFNGAQRLAYTGVILMGAGSLVTGLAIYKPTQLAWLTNLLGGYAWRGRSISP